MADAIPVVKEDAPRKEKPKAKPVPADEHEKYIGKDHPEFGRWVGCGWRLDN